MPDLIALLKDRDANVTQSARSALRDLTDRDFGPARDAGSEEREQAVAKWTAWWMKQRDR